jgi:hypothetical protein
MGMARGDVTKSKKLQSGISTPMVNPAAVVFLSCHLSHRFSVAHFPFI